MSNTNPRETYCSLRLKLKKDKKKRNGAMHMILLYQQTKEKKIRKNERKHCKSDENMS